MSGLFDDLDLESASDNPFEIPDDKYGLTITKVDFKKDHVGKNNADAAPRDYVILEYTINEGEHPTAIGQSTQEWFWRPKKGDDSQDAARAKSFLKKRLLSLGIPENRMNQIGPDDLIGIDVYGTMKLKGGFSNLVPGTVEVRSGHAAAGSKAFAGFK
jgi:hypothetical protein